MNQAGSRLLKIAAITAFVGPPILLISDLVHIFAGHAFEWTIGLWIALMLMIPAIIGFTYLVASRSGMLAIIGGCFAFFGLVAGASMQALFRVHAVLEEQGNQAAATQLKQTFKLVASTQMIGLTWPIGLLLLAIASIKAFPGNYVLPLVLAIGAVAFPIGRIAGSEIAIIVSGVAFIIGFWMFAPKLLAASRES